MTLVEALQNVDLEPGRTYQVRVRDKLVQVRVVAPTQTPLAMPADGEEMAMESWPDLPSPSSPKIVRATRSIFAYDRPFVITDDDLTPGDLD